MGNLQETLSKYFLNNVAKNFLVYDRASNDQIISIAATGFGALCWANMSLEGLMRPGEAARRIYNVMDTVQKNNPLGNRGWLSHFLTRNGRPLPGSEVSTIDTAIFWASLKRASYLLAPYDISLLNAIEDRISSIDIDWLYKGEYIRHGFFRNGHKLTPIECTWDHHLSEGIILYRLFNRPYHFTKVTYDLPLFVFYYSLCFLDEPAMINRLRQAIHYQKNNYHWWGCTSVDSPSGYVALDKNIISPLTIATLQQYFNLSNDQPHLPANEIQAFNPLTRWQSHDRIGIDDGACYALLAKLNRRRRLCV